MADDMGLELARFQVLIYGPKNGRVKGLVIVQDHCTFLPVASYQVSSGQITLAAWTLMSTSFGPISEGTATSSSRSCSGPPGG